MILRPSKSPRLLSTAACVAAYELRDASRNMTLQDLEPSVCPETGSSIGVLGHVKFDDDGVFMGVKFEMAAKPEKIQANEFHCYVSAMQGYSRAEQDLTGAAEDFWLHREADLRAGLFGRELVAMTDEELEAVPRYRRRLHASFHAKDLNDAMLNVLAIREREARENVSNFKQMRAWGELKLTQNFLADEAQEAITWWQSLTEFDRNCLPAYDCRTIGYKARAIFTYRDFMEQRQERLKQKGVELIFKAPLEPKKKILAT